MTSEEIAAELARLEDKIRIEYRLPPTPYDAFIGVQYRRDSPQGKWRVGLELDGRDNYRGFGCANDCLEDAFQGFERLLIEEREHYLDIFEHIAPI